MAVGERLKTKLQAISYPASDLFNIEDVSHLRNLIVWIEDRKIRAFSPENRFREINNDDKWNPYLSKHIGCPYNESEPYPLVDWLISKSLLFDAEEARKSVKNDSAVVNLNDESVDCFKNIDFNGEEFKQGVVKIAKLLDLPVYSDCKQLFKAICLFIEQKLDINVLNTAIREYGTYRIDVMKLDDVCLGFDVDDKDVKSAAIALRLMNVNIMRQLQNRANAAIVQVQQITADPKTDERLGKVGF